MSRNTEVSCVTIKLTEHDEPFQDMVNAIALSSDDLVFLVPSPKGEELVKPEWLERPTRKMDLSVIQKLLEECHPHTRPTVMGMAAVKAA